MPSAAGCDSLPCAAPRLPPHRACKPRLCLKLVGLRGPPCAVRHRRAGLDDPRAPKESAARAAAGGGLRRVSKTGIAVADDPRHHLPALRCTAMATRGGGAGRPRGHDRPPAVRSVLVVLALLQIAAVTDAARVRAGFGVEAPHSNSAVISSLLQVRGRPSVAHPPARRSTRLPCRWRATFPLLKILRPCGRSLSAANKSRDRPQCLWEGQTAPWRAGAAKL